MKNVIIKTKASKPALSNQPFCLNTVFKDNSICSISLQLSVSNVASTALHSPSGDAEFFHSLGLHAKHLKVYCTIDSLTKLGLFKEKVTLSAKFGCNLFKHLSVIGVKVFCLSHQLAFFQAIKTIRDKCLSKPITLDLFDLLKT